MTTALALTLSGAALIVVAALAHARDARKERNRFKARGDCLWLHNQQLERDKADLRRKLELMVRKDLERAFWSN
jgi:hypothetical protein